MRSRFQFCLLGLCIFAVLFLLTGCFGRFARPRTPDIVSPSGSYTVQQYNTDLTAYTTAIGAGQQVEAARLRNKIVYGLIAEVDYVYYDYKTKLFLNQGAFRVGSDFLQLGLSAGGAITNGARSKTILSALLTGVTGTSLSVDKNFFAQQTVQAIGSAMDAERNRIKTVILQQLKQDTSTYPFQAARADVIRYFFAGTLPAGLQQLHQEAASTAQTRETNLNQVQVTNISPEDVKCVSGVNQGFAKAFQTGDMTNVLKFLNAMGSPIDTSLPQDKIKAKAEASIRDLGDKIITDEALRKKYCVAAKDAQFIQ